MTKAKAVRRASQSEAEALQSAASNGAITVQDTAAPTWNIGLGQVVEVRVMSTDAAMVRRALSERGGSVLRVVNTADRGVVAQVAHYDGHRWNGVLVVSNGQAVADELETLELVEQAMIDDGSQGYRLKVAQ